MLNSNRTLKRCLVLSDDHVLIDQLNKILHAKNFLIDFSATRKSALRLFLQYRHYLFLIDTKFLPRYPHRLVQLFKMAHRTPGVIIFDRGEKKPIAFNYVGNCCMEIIEVPFSVDRVESVLCEIIRKLDNVTRNLFIRDMAIQAAVAVPLLCVLVFLLAGN